MKKRIFALIFAVLTVVMLTINVTADDEYYRLQDLTEVPLLTESENAEIMALLDEVSERQGMDIAILTVDAVEEGLTAEEDATEWYEYLGYGDDGAMLYISMEDGNWYYLTKGFGITAITDAGIDYISEKFLPSLSDGDYAGAFRAYIKYTDEFITQAKTGKPYDSGNMPKEPYNLLINLIICVGIGLIASLIITGIWKGQLKSVAFQTRATSYLKPGSLNIANSRDFFLYRTVDRREKEKESSSGGSTTHSPLPAEHTAEKAENSKKEFNMSIAGKWKVKKIMHFEEAEPKLITIDEFNAIPEEQRDEEQAQMASSVLDITEDGKLTMMIPIPAEAIEKARAEGAEVTDDGYVIADRFEWLKRDDKYFCLNESMGTDPMPLKFDDDGGLEFMGGLLIFERI